MAIKVGINGFGRIGRNVLRALYESGRRAEIKVVAKATKKNNFFIFFEVLV